MTNDKNTILVVDDNPTNLRLLMDYLEKAGYEVLVAEEGEVALELLKHVKPGLILLDVMMPGMDGFDVCREMRRDPRLKNLPILFLTAIDKGSDVVDGLRAGADDYVMKPFNPEELILRVQAILRRTKGEAAGDDSNKQMLKVGEASLDCLACRLDLPHGAFPLTPVQFDLVYHLMIHAGEPFTTHQLLRDVWDYPHDAGSPDLVRVHIKNLRRRIEPDSNNPTYIQTVPGHGYTFPDRKQ